uniref:(California timema) hypothetical protein n=1 Tax=Timema californicum TaxID=61474 RepID=A0A7R9P310_TIMCA|nr:unnamed protein product [Timema californicum]
MASDSEKRKLTELRVVDLRSELEKRDLDKNGVKAVLIERLEKVILSEDPNCTSYTPLSSRTEAIQGCIRIVKYTLLDADSGGHIHHALILRAGSMVVGSEELRQRQPPINGSRRKQLSFTLSRWLSQIYSIARAIERGEQDTDENHDQSDMEEDIKDESFTDGDTKEDVKIEIDPKKEPEEMLKSSEGEQKKAEPIESETSVKTPMTNTEDEVNVKKESEKSKTVSENTVTAESEKNDGKHTKESEKTDLDGIKSTGKTDSEPSKNSSKSIEKVDEVKSTTDQLTDTTNSNNEVDKQKLDIQSNKDADKDAPEANGVDNEDSINLTIGEDDEKLLAEEEESSQEKDSKVVKSTDEDAGGQKSQLTDATSQCGGDARNGSLIVPVDEGGVHKKERAGHGQDKQSTTVGEDKVKSQEEEGKASADKSKRFVSHTTVSTFTYTASTTATLDNTGFVFGDMELSTLQ